MAVVTREDIIRKTCEQTGLPVRIVRKVFRLFTDKVLERIAMGHMVSIEGFGHFRLGFTKTNSPQKYQFWPSDELDQALNDPDWRRLQVEKTPRKSPEIVQGLIAVHPVRPEDRQLIDRWLTNRMGATPEAASAESIFSTSDNVGPLNPWSEDTCRTANKLITAFARRCSVPLHKLGIDEHSVYQESVAREELVGYAADYEHRAKPRLERYAQRLRADEQNRGPLAFRTHGWRGFVEYGTEFYNWMERQGLRPRGSNPLKGIRKLPPIDYLKGKAVIVEKWYTTMLEHPSLTPRQRAILYLCANGFRCKEITQARLDRLDMKERTLTVVGKGRNGGKLRTVHLFRRTTKALDAYLKTRTHYATPYLFFNRRTSKPYKPVFILKLVDRLTIRIFPGERNALVRSKIKPHRFRHYFVSDSLRRGMKPAVIQAQVGHESLEIMKRYTNLDPKWIKQEVRRIDRSIK